MIVEGETVLSRVNILLTSHRFFPQIGGTETVAELLAEEFSKAGHETMVVTQSRDDKHESDQLSGTRKTSELYRVLRCPESRTLVRLYDWCDAVLQNQIGLQSAWPLLFIRRPWIIAHHNWLDIQKGSRASVKLRLLRFARNIAASQALADRLPVPVKVIPNPYRKELFKLSQPRPRPKDVIFAGRLIPGKGVHILIEALRECARRGTQRELTVVGDGPALAELRDRANGLAVEFVGSKRGAALSELLTSHRILVVPSIEPEPFGLIAIEGLACGCAVVASSHPGLIEALGRFGVFCDPGNSKALADAILQTGVKPPLLDGISQHLSRHDPQSVAREYLNVLEEEITKTGRVHSSRVAL